MKNLPTFEEFLFEAANNLTPEQSKLFQEIGKITDDTLKELSALCKKYKTKTVSRGTLLGGVNIVDSNKNILFDVNYFTSTDDKNVKMLQALSKNPTSSYEVQKGLPFLDSMDLVKKYPESYELSTKIKYLSRYGYDSLTPKAVKEYEQLVEELMDRIEKNFEYLKDNNLI
jgi:hypothetical protein